MNTIAQSNRYFSHELKLDITQLSFIEEEAQWHLCVDAIIYQNLPSCA